MELRSHQMPGQARDKDSNGQGLRPRWEEAVSFQVTETFWNKMVKTVPDLEVMLKASEMHTLKVCTL